MKESKDPDVSHKTVKSEWKKQSWNSMFQLSELKGHLHLWKSSSECDKTQLSRWKEKSKNEAWWEWFVMLFVVVLTSEKVSLSHLHQSEKQQSSFDLVLLDSFSSHFCFCLKVCGWLVIEHNMPSLVDKKAATRWKQTRLLLMPFNICSFVAKWQKSFFIKLQHNHCKKQMMPLAESWISEMRKKQVRMTDPINKLRNLQNQFEGRLWHSKLGLCCGQVKVKDSHWDFDARTSNLWFFAATAPDLLFKWLLMIIIIECHHCVKHTKTQQISLTHL